MLVNYYKHHIGDYDAATAHLSWDEDMAYSRLLRMYYRTEQAIPADMVKACRLIRANSKAERQAVDTVLREFFVLEEDGWHQGRCEEEIAASLAKAEINREVGKLGGNPKKKAGYNEPGWLYAIQKLDGGPIKVGISKWLDSRLSALRKQNGGIKVLSKLEVNDMGAAEAAVHGAFVGRLDGEWVKAEWEELRGVMEEVLLPYSLPMGSLNGTQVGSPGGSKLAAQATSQKPIANSQEPKVPKEKIDRALSAAAAPNGHVSTEEKRRRWAGKISNELCKREEPDRAMAIIDAWQRGEKWAQVEFDRVDAILKAGRA